MGQPKLLGRLPSSRLLSAAERAGVRRRRRRRRCRQSEYTCGRSHSIALAAPIINGPSVRARPPARHSLCPRWRDFGCADVSGNPLLLISPFPGTPDSCRLQVTHSPLSLFHRRNGMGKTKTHSVNTYAYADGQTLSTLEDGGTRYSQWRHSTAQVSLSRSHSLSS